MQSKQSPIHRVDVAAVHLQSSLVRLPLHTKWRPNNSHSTSVIGNPNKHTHGCILFSLVLSAETKDIKPTRVNSPLCHQRRTLASVSRKQNYLQHTTHKEAKFPSINTESSILRQINSWGHFPSRLHSKPTTRNAEQFIDEVQTQTPVVGMVAPINVDCFDNCPPKRCNNHSNQPILFCQINCENIVHNLHQNS